MVERPDERVVVVKLRIGSRAYQARSIPSTCVHDLCGGDASYVPMLNSNTAGSVFVCR